MIKRFKFESGMDISITLDVDTTVLSLELAKAINDFWSGNKEVLAACDGDVVQAVARRAVSPLMFNLLDGWTTKESVRRLSQNEGWPDETGMTIIDYDLPSFDPLVIELVQAR